jgi:hypothetical protein
MNPTVLVIALIAIGFVGGKLLMRRLQQVGKTQAFGAVAAWLGAVSTVAREGRAPLPGPWFYTSLIVAAIMGTFLLLALFRRWDTRPPTRSV